MASSKGFAPDPVPAYLSPDGKGGLLWGRLFEGVLLRRYKRFLADVRLIGGEEVVAHTANTGSMLGCSRPGRTVWLSRHDAGARKHPFTWEMIDMPATRVGVNTGVPNRLVKAAALAGRIPEFPFPAAIRSEVSLGNSRLDLLLSAEGRPDVYVEIKNCSLAEDGVALFPDAVTARGAKHLEELAGIAAQGCRAVLFVLAQRADVVRFKPADHIDPHWGQTLRRAIDAGVELLAYRADLTLEGVAIGERLTVDL